MHFIYHIKVMTSVNLTRSKCEDKPCTFFRTLKKIVSFRPSANFIHNACFRCFREDLGFRIVCEQVSHHPPISAFHVESSMYTFHGTVHPKLKFWGKSVEVTPKGLVTLHLKRSVLLLSSPCHCRHKLRS